MIKVGRLYRENLISTVRQGVESRTGIFLLSYSHLSSAQMSILRKDLKKIGAEVVASRNTLAKLALKELNHEHLSKEIEGQTLFVWSNSDSAEVSKTLVNFSKEFKDVVVRAGLLDGNILKQNDIRRLSDLPSKEVLLSQLLQVIQSPITGIMNALNGKTRELIYLLKQLSEQKGGK